MISSCSPVNEQDRPGPDFGSDAAGAKAVSFVPTWALAIGTARFSSSQSSGISNHSRERSRTSAPCRRTRRKWRSPRWPALRARIGGGGDEGGGAHARADAEDLSASLRTVLAHPAHRAEDVALLHRAEARQLPAALPMRAKIERQHVESARHEPPAEDELVRLVRPQPVADDDCLLAGVRPTCRAGASGSASAGIHQPTSFIPSLASNSTR